MIRDPEDLTNLKLSVYLKNGTEFLNKDCTSSPMSDKETIISFWDSPNRLVCFPLDQVETFVYHF